ncbi:hypothetical protein HW115_19140 [Verrucomicrobiaceae bacterium N1E253]|uniref:Uncharacterized protein n=1 Tax=Oceaniferula marina TaxID=2748318 RepID=A0A851GL08_9BACT|nr:hypothetical protein [Oceaniferula marina]NWK57742.1 hypothetical protein [Oceaniferula marina]
MKATLIIICCALLFACNKTPEKTVHKHVGSYEKAYMTVEYRVPHSEGGGSVKTLTIYPPFSIDIGEDWLVIQSTSNHAHKNTLHHAIAVDNVISYRIAQEK